MDIPAAEDLVTLSTQNLVLAVSQELLRRLVPSYDAARFVTDQGGA